MSTRRLSRKGEQMQMISGKRTVICLLALAIAAMAAVKPFAGLFTRDNLVAWCIVPYDAGQRTPEQRAEMLKRIGITRLAYDWREKDIPTFDREIDALQKNGITLQAFWTVVPLDAARPDHTPEILDLL